MKKKFKNINEELNRIKELLNENNLLLEDTSSCGSENTILSLVKKILIDNFKKIKLDDFKSDTNGCFLKGTLDLTNYKYTFIFWENRWFKINKEKKSDYFEFNNNGNIIKMKKQFFRGYYYLTTDYKSINFGELNFKTYIDDRDKKLELPTVFDIGIKTLKDFFEYIEFILNKEEKKELKTNIDRDIPYLYNTLTSNWINEDDFDNIIKTIEPYLNSNTYCYLDAKFYLENKKHIGELIDDIKTIKFTYKINNLIIKIKDQKCK